MPYTMQIKLHSFQITAVNQMGNSLKMSSNVAYGVLPLKEWIGYWQGNHREGELLGMKAFAPNEISSQYFKRLEEQAAYDEILMAA